MPECFVSQSGERMKWFFFLGKMLSGENANSYDQAFLAKLAALWAVDYAVLILLLLISYCSSRFWRLISYLYRLSVHYGGQRAII